MRETVAVTRKEGLRMQPDSSSEQRVIDSTLQAWRFNADRIDKFFNALSPDQLEQEVVTGRNRLIYLWGHIAAVNDALFPLLGLGPKLYPEMDSMFITNPDRDRKSVVRENSKC